MKKSKHTMMLILGALFLFFSCNKGNFDPTSCDDCPELTTCYGGICDCDTNVSDKFWNRCYEKMPARYVCLDPDTNFSRSIFLLDSVAFDMNQNEYRFEMYSDESHRLILFPVDLKTHPVNFHVTIIPQTGYDSIIMRDDLSMFDHNGTGYLRSFRGKRFGSDSLELRMHLQDWRTFEFGDTSRNMTFRKQ